jgi:hypothetical protein
MSVQSFRAASIAGAASALLLFFGAGQLFGPTPDTSNKSADEVAALWVKFINDRDHRTSIVIGTFLIVLGAIGLIWFAGALRERIGLGPGPMYGFALLAAVGAAAATVGPLTLVGGEEFSSDPLPTDGHVIWMVFSLAFPFLLVVFGFGMSAFLVSVALTGRAVLPAWLIWFAWLGAIAGIFGVLFIPMAVVLLWLLVAGIYGALRPAGPTPAAAAA